MSGGDRESLGDVRHWSEGYPGCEGVVGTPFQMFRSGRKCLPDVRERS